MYVLPRLICVGDMVGKAERRECDGVVKWLYVEPSTTDRLLYTKQWILSLGLMNMLTHISENQFR